MILEHAHNFLQILILTINSMGAVVVIWGVFEAIAAFVTLKFSSRKKDAVSASESIRQGLGAHLLLGLEIFIAADILSSSVSPSWEKVGVLAAIVGVRTVLSYFLRLEVRQGIACRPDQPPGA